MNNQTWCLSPSNIYKLNLFRVYQSRANVLKSCPQIIRNFSIVFQTINNPLRYVPFKSLISKYIFAEYIIHNLIFTCRQSAYRNRSNSHPFTKSSTIKTSTYSTIFQTMNSILRCFSPSNNCKWNLSRVCHHVVHNSSTCIPHAFGLIFPPNYPPQKKLKQFYHFPNDQQPTSTFYTEQWSQLPHPIRVSLTS